MNNTTNFDPLAEQKAKMEAQYQACSGQVGQGLAGNFAGQPGIRECVAQNLSRAQQEARRTDALYELQHLFEKHPDVARILDLLETAQLIRT
jgi:3-methyladenine DNA glycosylase/8-oxoguanine DNA glycosylase